MMIYRYILFILLPGIRVVNKGDMVMICMILGVRDDGKGKWGVLVKDGF